MTQKRRFAVDGSPIEFREGQTVLEAMLCADLHPTGGGCLCAAGDCPHCLVSVDGVAYVRACQVAARPGLVVATEHRGRSRPPNSEYAPPSPVELWSVIGCGPE